jgi:hypothetical protein
MATVPLDTRFIGIAPEVNLTERKSAVINTQTQPYTMQDIVDTAGGGSYLKYVALLSQVGTDAPTATVLENTLGETITYTRSSAGLYYIVTTGIFPENKTWAVANTPSYNSNGPFALQIGRVGDTECILYCYSLGASLMDLDTNGDATSIEIRVYP